MKNFLKTLGTTSQNVMVIHNLSRTVSSVPTSYVGFSTGSSIEAPQESLTAGHEIDLSRYSQP